MPFLLLGSLVASGAAALFGLNKAETITRDLVGEVVIPTSILSAAAVIIYLTVKS